MTDWKIVRDQFPALQNWTYLNSATFGQMPRRAVEAVAAHFAHRDELACADGIEWFHDADRVREKVARLVNCSADDVAFVPNAATALALIVNGIDWRPGDQVVTLADEFPNYLYLSGHAQRLGIEYVQVPWRDLLSALNDRVRLVALSEVNYANGFRLPVQELSRVLRERRIPLFLDGTQSTGALRFDASACDVDLFVVDGYKWLLSPTGAGFMVVPKRTREWLRPNVIGWRSHFEWRRVDSLHQGVPQFAERAEKYEGAMLPFPLLFGMEATIDFMLEIGTGAIESRVLALAEQSRDVLRRCGAEIPSTQAPLEALNLQGSGPVSQIANGRFPGRDVSAISVALRDQKVLTAARHGHLRVSPHFYNNEDDLDRLESTLRKILA
jgi:selenocysteine lyase/cysteine desulfurase